MNISRRILIVTTSTALLAMIVGVTLFRSSSRDHRTTRLSASASAAPSPTHPTGDTHLPPSVASGSSREDLLATLRTRLGPAATPDEIMGALNAIARHDTGLAIDLAHALGRTEEEKTTWVADLARQWSQRDPQQAWDWLSKQEALHLRDLAVGTLPEVMIGTMAQHNPTLLLRNVDQLVRTGETPLGVAPVVAVHLGLEALAASQQLEAARAAVETWARDPAKPAIGEAAYVTVANALAKSGRAEDAAQWMLSLPAGAERAIALVEFPAHWGQTDPRAALNWIEQNSPAELRDAAVRRTFNDWTERSSAEAGEWLGNYLTRAPVGAETDRLIGAVINLGPGAKSNPTVALQWTGLLSDPAARASAEEKVVLRWARQDESAATAYLATSPNLSSSRKQAMLQKIASPTFRNSEG
jgi:hypothetical protein